MGESLGRSKRVARDSEGRNIRIPADMRYADWKKVYIDRTLTLRDWQRKSNDLLQASTSSGKIKPSSPEEPKTPVHLKQAFDKATLYVITAKVAVAPVNIQKVWNLAYDQIQIADKEYVGRSHYSQGLHAIFFNLKNDTTSPIFAPYKDFFHEVGHLIDHWLGNYSSYLSVTYNGGIFAKTLKEEAEECIKRVRTDINAKTDFDTHREILKDLLKIPLAERFEVSDMWHGASNRKINAGVKHTEYNYWVKDKGSNVPREAFAHMFGASIYNSSSIEQIKKYFPRSYSLFEEMISDLLNGRGEK